ncbi:MAG TPA: acetolactate synthase small subunit [Fimbriimonadaceae bacterium]|jgi:acetolactate synthase-1/3 small subunit
MAVGQHTITALVQNESGTLNRLVSLFRRRMFSLSSLNAGDCEQEGYSRLTFVVNGDDNVLRQCLRQLEKLIDVVEVDDLPVQASVQRELALVQVSCGAEKRREVLEIAQVMDCDVLHMSHDKLTLQCTAEAARLDNLIELLKPYGIGQVVRSGLVAMRVA